MDNFLMMQDLQGGAAKFNIALFVIVTIIVYVVCLFLNVMVNRWSFTDKDGKSIFGNAFSIVSYIASPIIGIILGFMIKTA